MKVNDLGQRDDKIKRFFFHGCKLLIFKFCKQVKFFVSLSLLEIYRMYAKDLLMHKGL